MPGSGDAEAEWASPPSPQDPIPGEPGAFDAGHEPVAKGLGDPPPEWSGYYSYPSRRFSGTEGQDPYAYEPGDAPAYGDGRYRAGYWAAPPPAPRRGRPLTVALAVVAGLVLLVAGIGGGIRMAPHLRGLTRATTPAPRGGIRAGGTGSSAAVDIQGLESKLDPSIVDISGVKLDATGMTVEDDSGTGVIISKSGEVLTNNHVIEGDAQLQATLANRDTYPIKVLGEDPTDDVALVRIQGLSDLPAIALRSGPAATIGESVAAFGNALGRGGQPAATQGQVTNLNQTITATLDSASERSETLGGLIEMSAQICPGDSGGLLADAPGDDLGILTAASTPTTRGGPGGGSGGGNGGAPQQGQCSNDGFVIPIAHALTIVQQIRSGKRSAKVIIGIPGFLGVEVQECTEASAAQGSCQPPAVNGAQITQLVQGGAAEQAGFPQAFVITAIGETQITDPSDLTTALEQTSPGQAVQVTWNDGLGGASETTTVTLGSGPPA